MLLHKTYKKITLNKVIKNKRLLKVPKSKPSKLDFTLRSFQATLSVIQNTFFLISGIKKVCGLLVKIYSNECMNKWAEQKTC